MLISCDDADPGWDVRRLTGFLQHSKIAYELAQWPSSKLYGQQWSWRVGMRSELLRLRNGLGELCLTDVIYQHLRAQDRAMELVLDYFTPELLPVAGSFRRENNSGPLERYERLRAAIARSGGVRSL